MPMNYKRYLLGLTILLVLATLLVCFIQFQDSKIQVSFKDTNPIPTYQPPDKNIPLRIVMISVLNYKDTAKYQRQMAQRIGYLLERPVLVMHRKRYSEINQLLIKGDADLGLLSTGAYCIYSSSNDFKPLVAQQRHQVPYYYSYVIVSNDSPYKTLDDLRDKTFAFVDPLSYSGYLSIQEKLRKQNKNAKNYFELFYFTYSHDASINAVLEGQVDGAVVDSLAYDYVKKHRPDNAAKIKIIETLPPRGTGPIVARKYLPNTDKIQQVLLNLHKDPLAREAMEHLMIDRFIIPQPELYPSIDWRELEEK